MDTPGEEGEEEKQVSNGEKGLLSMCDQDACVWEIGSFYQQVFEE